MRLLILSFSYSPRTNPRATRWTTLAEQFVREGHDVSVITSWQPGLPEKDVVHGVRIYRTGMRALELLRKKISSNPAANESAKANEQALSATPSRSDGNLIKRSMGMINRVIWRNLWWPDSACVWLVPALGVARRLLAEKPADMVISVSPAFSSVVTGHILARDRQSCRSWVIDLGDPFSFVEQAPPNNSYIYGRLNRWFEKRAFQRADGISVTTDETRAQYGRLYPFCTEKIRVIPPLMSPACEPTAVLPLFSNNGATRLVFIGSLYRKLRRPDYLLRLFCAMLRARPGLNCELHMIGDTHECRDSLALFQQQLGSNLVVHGPVDRDTAMAAMAGADILVNLGNETPFQLPSKLVEYASTGKRILSISSLAKDSSAAFLDHYPGALCLQDQGGAPSEEQVLKLARFCEGSAWQPMGISEISAFMHPFGLASVSRRYKDLFEMATCMS